jgi:hypothetical protein
LSAVLLVPYTTLNAARSLRGEPLVFDEGATQRTVAVPLLPQVQVSVKERLEVMLGNVCVPEAAFVPDHPPLAAQLAAVGLVDHVRTGVMLPVADV